MVSYTALFSGFPTLTSHERYLTSCREPKVQPEPVPIRQIPHQKIFTHCLRRPKWRWGRLRPSIPHRLCLHHPLRFRLGMCLPAVCHESTLSANPAWLSLHRSTFRHWSPSRDGLCTPASNGVHIIDRPVSTSILERRLSRHGWSDRLGSCVHSGDC